MKAAVLKAFGSPLSVETLPDPVVGTGEVIVDIVATSVINYSNEVFSGARKYLLDLPVAPGPGGIGRIRAFGPDATHLKLGDWVYCDPAVRSRDDAMSPDITLQGWSARGEGGLRLQKHFRHGSWAEQMLTPTENAIRIGDIDPADAPSWCKIGAFLVPYGGLLAAKLEPGETLLINGATGNFGAAGVAVALALGAGAVIATGRNEAVLAELVRRFGARVRPVKMTGDEDADRREMQRAAGRPIDCVLDILPPAAKSDLGPGGRHGGSSLRASGADGRRRHARRRRTGAALCVDHAQLRNDHRPVVVPTGRAGPHGPPHSVRANQARRVRHHAVRARRRQ